MKTINISTPLSIDEMVSSVQKEPLQFESNGKPLAVVVSQEDFERYEALEEAWLATQADKAKESKEWMTEKESESYMKDVLDA